MGIYICDSGADIRLQWFLLKIKPYQNYYWWDVSLPYPGLSILLTQLADGGRLATETFLVWIFGVPRLPLLPPTDLLGVRLIKGTEFPVFPDIATWVINPWDVCIMLGECPMRPCDWLINLGDCPINPCDWPSQRSISIPNIRIRCMDTSFHLCQHLVAH